MKSKTFLKLASLLLVLALFVGSFAGCKKDDEDTGSFSMGGFNVVNDNDDAGDDGETTNANATESSSKKNNTKKKNSAQIANGGDISNMSSTQLLKNIPEKLKGTTLTFMYWEDLKNTDYGNVIAEFEKRSGITVKTKVITKNDYYTELAGAIAAGNSPDMVKCIYNQSHVVKNLQPIDCTGFNFNADGWDTEIMKDFTFNGKTYAMQTKNSPQYDACVVYYNKKALRKADMEDPYTIWKNNPSSWTWDKLWSMCETFLNKNGNKEGYYGIGFGIEEAYVRCFNGGFYGFDNNSGKFVSYMKASETLNRYTTLMDKISKRYSNSTWDKNSFVMGNTLFACTFSSALEKNNAYWSQLGDNVGCVPIPTDSTSVPGFEYNTYGVPIGAKNAAAVPYFVRFVFDPEIYDMNDFYKSEQAKEIIDYTKNKAKLCYNYGWTWEIWNAMVKGGSAQVKTVLDTYAPKIDDTVAVANGELASLKK